jgi:hypothetical protein
MKRVGGMGVFNHNESRIMTKVVNRKTGLVFNVDCSINSLSLWMRELILIRIWH